MNKLLGLAFLIYIPGDPDLSLFTGFGFSPQYVMSLLVALITIPWVIAQLEG